MRMIPIDSSNLDSAGYDPLDSILRVSFKNARQPLSKTTYEYSDVPQRVFTELLESGSPGSYFNDNIKYSFKYQKL